MKKPCESSDRVHGILRKHLLAHFICNTIELFFHLLICHRSLLRFSSLLLNQGFDCLFDWLGRKDIFFDLLRVLGRDSLAFTQSPENIGKVDWFVNMKQIQAGRIKFLHFHAQQILVNGITAQLCIGFPVDGVRIEVELYLILVRKRKIVIH